MSALQNKIQVWAVLVLIAGLLVYGAVSAYLAGFPDGISTLVLSHLIVISFVTIGGLVAVKRPGNPVGWFMLAGAFFLLLPWATVWSGNLGFGLWIFFTFLYFPDGRLPSGRWRPVAWIAAGFLLVRVAADMLRLQPLQSVLDVLLFILFLTVLASVFVRYRRTGAAERQQIKWLAYSAILVAILFLLGVFGFFSGWASEMFFNILFITCISSIPSAMGIAILRNRLWDIDIIIRRTLVYAALTATLALVYFGSVVVLQRALGGMGGRQDSPAAVVLSTLGIAALFSPLRRRIQNAIDRRFYRRKYDAEQALAALGLSLRYEFDLETLSAALLDVVEETMRPDGVALWLLETAAGGPQPGHSGSLKEYPGQSG